MSIVSLVRHGLESCACRCCIYLRFVRGATAADPTKTEFDSKEQASHCQENPESAKPEKHGVVHANCKRGDHVTRKHRNEDRSQAAMFQTNGSPIARCMRCHNIGNFLVTWCTHRLLAFRWSHCWRSRAWRSLWVNLWLQQSFLLSLPFALALLAFALGWLFLLVGFLGYGVSCGGQLSTHQRCICTIFLQQLVMRSLLYVFTSLHYDDLVRGDDSRQSVSNEHYTALSHHGLDHLLQCLLHLPLTLCVQGRGRFIEQQQRWLSQERPGDSQPLPLSSAETRTTFSNHRFVTHLHLGDERVRIGLLCSSNYHLIGDFLRWQTVDKIVMDWSAKHLRLLCDHTDASVVLTQAPIRKWSLIQKDLPSLGIVESQDQVHQC
mmetsp:Transcript_36236/g.82069  ORF Transcript_36236/g.82069 Transcript_36236/m.82069 type:complete len:378 (-) Transcript_36236:1207-2340(-)